MSTEAHRPRWSRPLAGIATVAVVGAGLGAFFGIRAAVGAGSASQAGQPSARTGAAMAFDAADGSVVLFGGQSRTRSLADTWTWDGSRWTQAHPATSPPALGNAQMSYDPVSREVILVGEAPVAGWNLGVAVCAGGSGSSSSSSGSAATRIPQANPIPAASPIPIDTPVPTGTAEPGRAIPTSTPSCRGLPSPKAATWLWNGSDWSRSSASTPDATFGGSTLAIDPVSGRVVLLARGPFAEPALGEAQPAIACPLQRSGSQPNCPLPFTFTPGWSWNGHQWKAMASNASTYSFGVAGSSIVDDAVSGRLATFGGDFIAPLPQPLPCEGCVSRPPVKQSACAPGTESIPVTQSACGTGTVRVWNGTSWKLQATFQNGPPTPGVSFTGDPATHSDVLLTGDGQTWLWTGTWTRVHPRSTPPIVSGAASAYDALSGQVVVFGGFGSSARESGLYDQTWMWNGSDWTQRGGSARPAVSIPIPSPVGVPPGRPCLPVAEPAQPLLTPASESRTVCKGISTGVISGGSAGVAAPSPAKVAAAP